METAVQGILSRDEMESRRLLAAGDLQIGLSQSEIARKFGVSRTTASRWTRALKRKGVEALHKRRATGRPCRLSAEQKTCAIEVFHAGARESGFPDDRWTTARFAAAIHARIGIRYDPDHMGRIMHRLGLRERVPVRVVEVAQPAYSSAYVGRPSSSGDSVGAALYALPHNGN